MKKILSIAAMLMASVGAVVVVSSPASALTCAPLGDHTSIHAWVYETTAGGAGGCANLYVKGHVVSTSSGLSHWTPIAHGYDFAMTVDDYYVYSQSVWGN